MGLGHAPQLVATVVLVDHRGLPGVFVDVEVTLGVDMALARFQGRDHMPYPAQLVTGQVLVDVPGLEDVGVLELRIVELVAVGGDEQLFLAFQLPVVTVRRAVVHVQVVRSSQAVSSGTRTIIGNLRCLAYAALASVVHPRLARFLYLVQRFMN
ncbi:hypothetical protein D9M71_508180 [compost metagenome]